MKTQGVNLVKRLRMPLPELEAFYRERRQERYEQGVELKNIGARRLMYPLFRAFLRVDRLFRGQSIELLGERPSVPAPAIFACTHIAQNDLENIYETLHHSCWWFLGDPRELYKDVSGLLIHLNGSIFLDTDHKRDRQIAYARAVELLRAGGSLMIFPEGARNGSENLPVMPIFAGTARMAVETGTSIVPVAIEQFDKRFVIKFGSVLQPQEHESSDELSQTLRDALATLKWEIWEREGVQQRSSLPADCRAAYRELFRQRILPFDTPEFIDQTRYHTKEELAQRDAFAHLDTLVPCRENAFLFRREP